MGLATLLQDVREIPESYRYARIAGVPGMSLGVAELARSPEGGAA